MLVGKTAIVTGATRLQGIGAAVCREMAASGANILFTYWTEHDKKMPWKMGSNEPELLMEELRKWGTGIHSIEADLSRPESWRGIMAEAEKVFGQSDILVNNAAYSSHTDFLTLTAEELDRHYAVNVKGLTMLSLEFARAFSKGSGGRIISMTSGQSLGPMPGEIAYAATKGAIEALTLTLSAELAAKGITVNAINPGPTDSGTMTEHLKEKLVKKFPFHRIGTPEDAARLACFLAGDEAGWITGQVIHSEGGFRR
ncbi:SDR family oxidoreductase [Metabacillus sp. GX 13764]|uniref:SDR family oxidoreductase n=1 Tax=Metabacillus kandeliae TaxID=2900151 RepID=UPI001E375FD1|nr:SDR family oxidoreductase [Metabacillus kandeliae]MCD7033561.1 SDR family oxidoreductase [Metabacillus kandeliae]